MKLIVASAGIAVSLVLTVLAGVFFNNGYGHWIHVCALGLALLIPCLWWLIAYSRDRSAIRPYQAEKQRFEDNLPLISEEDREELIRLAPHEKPAPIKKYMQWPVALSVLLLGAAWIAFPLPLQRSPQLESGEADSSQPATISETTSTVPTPTPATATSDPTPTSNAVETPAETTVQPTTNRAPVVPPVQPRVSPSGQPPVNEPPEPPAPASAPPAPPVPSPVAPPILPIPQPPANPDPPSYDDDLFPADPNLPDSPFLPFPALPGL